MASAPFHAARSFPHGEPAWDIARLFPAQGAWSEHDYLSLNGNYLVEFTHGHVEVLPMPTDEHQAIVAFLYDLLSAFARPLKLGIVRFAPLRVRVGPGRYREPDILFLLQEHEDRRGNEYWSAADLVMEVVSDDNRRHDLETKRFEYARAGIPEYWIVDPQHRQITVLKLAGEGYEEHGVFGESQRATSVLLPGFAVDVSETFRSAQQSA